MAGSPSSSGSVLFMDTCVNNTSDILFKISVKKTIGLLKCISRLKVREKEECLEFPSCSYEMVPLPSLDLPCYQSQNSVLLKSIIDGLLDTAVSEVNHGPLDQMRLCSSFSLQYFLPNK